MRKYEIMYIINPSVADEERKTLIESVNNIFTKMSSTVTNVNEWGMRELAYEIDKCRKGYYVVLNVESTHEAILEFERVSRINESIMRFLCVREDE